MQELVNPNGIEGIDDLADGKAALHQLEDDQQDLQQALTDLENAEDRLGQAESQIEKIEDKVEDIFERLDLPVGDDEAVRERCERFEDYEKVKEEARSAKQKVDFEEEPLRSGEGFEESMLSAEIEELEKQKEEVASPADKKEELSDKISRIRQKIDAAKEEHGLEDVLAEREAAREKLNRRRQNDARSVIGQASADVIHRRTRNQDLPEVFGRAAELFRQITTDRYRLDLDREKSALRVVTNDERWLGLSELSSGTKVQFLFAVCIAFVERQEQGANLPLVLDETLANSDDVKARFVIEAVRTICRDGRQVFYLTAQSDEVGKWRRHLQGTETALTIHELSGKDSASEDRFYQVGGNGEFSAGRPTAPELPEPGELSHSELKDPLHVPQWTPRMQVSKLHLWYLTDDIDLLCKAAEKSYRTWGQLSSLANRNGLSLIGLTDEEYRRMEALSRAVQAWREAWLIGRGDPVDLPALEDTSAVSENFIDRVTDLAKRVDGQAERIVEELEEGAVKRFRSDKIEELEAYFREEGYRSDRDPLGPEACWRRAIAEISDAVSNGLIAEDEVEDVLDRMFKRIEDSDLISERKM